jgi:hypothetical protein
VSSLGVAPERSDGAGSWAGGARWRHLSAAANLSAAASAPSAAVHVLRPIRILAWREVNEIAGRTLMRDGRWVV